jgi:phage baseplate assembly protein V
MSTTDTIRKFVAPIERRVRAIAARCIINLVNDAAELQQLQISALPGETLDGLLRMQEYGFTSKPFPGAEGAAIFLLGDRNAGIVIACDDRRYRLKGLADGEVALYDDLGQKLHLTRTGIVIHSEQAVTVEAPSIVLAGGGPAVARVGDTVTCPAGVGHITSGSEKVQSG